MLKRVRISTHNYKPKKGRVDTLITFELAHATFTNFPATENPDGTYNGDYDEFNLAVDIAHHFAHRHGKPAKKLMGDWATVKKLWEAGKGTASVSTH
jgi:hypothetical protein